MFMTRVVILTDIYASSTNLNLDHTCTNLSSGDYPTHTQIHVGIIFREIIVHDDPKGWLGLSDTILINFACWTLHL